MARRTLNRKELRDQYDAAERRKHEDDDDQDEEGDEGAEDDDEVEAEAEDEDEEEEEEAEEEAPKKKKPAAKPAKPRSRTRTPKVVRMKVIWGVFNNSNQRVQTFAYPQRKEAEELAAKLTLDKKNTHFVQPVKEPIEEKKEKEA
jgi:hypothetical protein